VAGAEAAGVQAAGLVAEVVVDVAVAEHPAALLGPVPVAQAAADAALAIAESPLYRDVHLKYLRAGGRGNCLGTPISPRMPRYFKFFHACWPPRRGRHACSMTRLSGPLAMLTGAGRQNHQGSGATRSRRCHWHAVFGVT